MLPRILGAAAVLASLSALAACGNSTSAPPLKPTVLPAADGSAGAGSGYGECTASGTPGQAITLRHVRTVLGYVTSIEVGPHQPDSRASVGPVTLPATPVPFVHADGPLTAADRQAVLASGSATWSGRRLTSPRTLRIVTPMPNPTGHSERWVVYAPVRFETGTVAVRECGAPYDDGTAWTRIRGTYGTYGDPPKVAYAVECGTTPASRLAAAALRKGGC